VEPPASRREPPVRGERGPQRGKAPRAGSWGCSAARAAPRAGRPRASRPAGTAGRAGWHPRRGTRPAGRNPRAPAAGSVRGGRADGDPSAEPGARPGTRRSRRRPRAPRDGPATVAREPERRIRPQRRGPVRVQRRTSPASGAPRGRAGPSAAERCGRRPTARRQAGGRWAAGPGCGRSRDHRRRGRGRRSGRPGRCRHRVRTGRRSCVPREPCGPSRCSCRLLPSRVRSRGRCCGQGER
jgi:hypothetical protein